MAIMPVLTPVVAPVSYRDIGGPTLAGLAAVAIITRRSYADTMVDAPIGAPIALLIIVTIGVFHDLSPTGF